MKININGYADSEENFDQIIKKANEVQENHQSDEVILNINYGSDGIVREGF
ncbi:hypothetical protein [Apilactobacillus timberlakei]|uniref:hypothetical protein n=1 Tax=Apilactobacillus timberlakei TaxID=2008380 RepID=UPI0012FFE6E8|nr:hypothetical protein [Apilactobacillus timberlakei]